MLPAYVLTIPRSRAKDHSDPVRYACTYSSVGSGRLGPPVCSPDHRRPIRQRLEPRVLAVRRLVPLHLQVMLEQAGDPLLGRRLPGGPREVLVERHRQPEGLQQVRQLAPHPGHSRRGLAHGRRRSDLRELSPPCLASHRMKAALPRIRQQPAERLVGVDGPQQRSVVPRTTRRLGPRVSAIGPPPGRKPVGGFRRAASPSAAHWIGPSPGARPPPRSARLDSRKVAAYSRIWYPTVASTALTAVLSSSKISVSVLV